MGPKPRDPSERFWEKVNKNGPIMPGMKTACWIWTASLTTAGYGKFGANAKRTVNAHHFSYELKNGKLQRGRYACHECDNRPCVNPNHLFEGDAMINNGDMARKLRGAIGDKNGSRKFPDRIPRGGTHWTHLHPERIARGDRHGSKTTPEHFQGPTQIASSSRARAREIRAVLCDRNVLAGGMCSEAHPENG